MQNVEHTTRDGAAGVCIVGSLCSTRWRIIVIIILLHDLRAASKYLVELIKSNLFGVQSTECSRLERHTASSCCWLADPLTFSSPSNVFEFEDCCWWRCGPKIYEQAWHFARLFAAVPTHATAKVSSLSEQVDWVAESKHRHSDRHMPHPTSDIRPAAIIRLKKAAALAFRFIK